MLEEQGIQPQPRRPGGDAFPRELGSESFRKSPTPAYGWLLVLVLALAGGIGTLSCLGLLAAGWLFAVNAPSAAPAPPPPVVAPAPQPPADRE